MFQRRLILIFACFLLVASVLAAQAWRLTWTQGDEFLAEAEKRLVRERWTPTVRGRIYDRNGRVLAADAPSFDVQVDYRLITRLWAWKQAASDAWKASRDEWGELDTLDRERLIRARLPEYEEKLEKLWNDLARALNVSRDDIEQRKADIIRTVQFQTGYIWENQRRQREEELSRDREIDVDVTLGDVADTLGIQVQAYPLASGLTDEQVAPIRRIAAEFEGVQISTGSTRDYPYESVLVRAIDRSTFPTPLKPAPDEPAFAEVMVDGVATHILGDMRSMWREDRERRPRYAEIDGQRTLDRGYYRTGDTVGAFGVEAEYENTLRGLRGIRTQHRDTNEVDVIREEPGDDVVLTLDIRLQARIHALMQPELGLAVAQPWHTSERQRDSAVPVGTPLNGAAVVLDILSGEVLAMVSTPSFTRAQLDEDPDAIWQDEVNTPGVNRCIAKPYPPGSIVKPLILAGAVTEGAYSLDEPIACTGAFDPRFPNRNRCWIWKQYHITHTDQFGRALDAHEAIGVSCNVYFHTLAHRLRLSGIEKWYRAFGVGVPFNLGVGLEHDGRLTPFGGRRTDINDAVMMGIGQGPVTWTPLHAAHAYALLAGGGETLRPRIVSNESPQYESFDLDRAAVDAAIKGLRESVGAIDGMTPEIYGTGSVLNLESGREPIFNAEGVRIVGKTGTADAPDILVDPDGEDGPLAPTVARTGDHSWFVILVGPEDGSLRYAVAVLMEYAGSGGRVSGPIANQIVHALKSEGYL